MADLRCYLTKSGIAAENNAKQFGTTLKITEMVFDGSYLADEENPENLTEVINPVLTVPCSTTISDDEQTLTFKGSILVEQGGFNVWGIGLKTDSGVLYGYARSKGDKILTEDEGATESVRYAVDIITKNSDVIEIKINQSTVYADLEDVDNAVKAGIDEHESKIDPHSQYNPENSWLALSKLIVPVGSPIPWPSDVLPESGVFGFMKGQVYDMDIYTELAKLYPDGVIPDMRGLGIIGKEDGELILAYEEGQVKEHGHPNSTVSSTDLGTKTTNTDSHYHAVVSSTRASKENASNDETGGWNYLFDDGTTRSTTTDSHAHTVVIGSHAHSVAIALFGNSKNTIDHRKFNWIVRLA